MFYLQDFALIVIVFLIPTNVMMGHVYWTVTNVMEMRSVQMAVMRGQRLVVSVVVCLLNAWMDARLMHQMPTESVYTFHWGGGGYHGHRNYLLRMCFGEYAHWGREECAHKQSVIWPPWQAKLGKAPDSDVSISWPDMPLQFLWHHTGNTISPLYFMPMYRQQEVVQL